MRRVSAHGMRQLKMRSGSAQREAQARGAQSAKREAQSAEREARSAKRVRDKYIYISGRAGFCSGRPASACRRCLTARPPSVARATGRPPRPRQLRERAPSLSHAAGRGRSQRARRAGVSKSRRFQSRETIQNAPETEAFSERAGVRREFRARRSLKLALGEMPF